MRLPHAIPENNGTERARRAKKVRDAATEHARLRPHAQTGTNGEEVDYASACFPSSFTKGLKHNQFGILARHDDYAAFVEALNSHDTNLFDSGMFAAQDHNPLDGDEQKELFKCKAEFGPDPSRVKCGCEKDPHAPEGRKEEKRTPDWRGWESPRAGHVYDLEGPDSGAVGMAPAPRVVSSELAAEMAEVYALALLRDVPFTTIVNGTKPKKLCSEGGDALLSSKKVAELLNQMPFFSGKDAVSSTLRSCHPNEAKDPGKRLDAFERNRRYSRTLSDNNPFDAPLSCETLFRGSTKGAHKGPYISQFLLMGTPSLATLKTCDDGPASAIDDATEGLEDGYIRYGTQFIDQRVTVHKPCFDHMTNWNHWLDVQNGANFKGKDRYLCKRRFITTPRDLATYVHFDALYQAYLNAVLILDALGTPVSKGFPEPSFVGGGTHASLSSAMQRTPPRTGFATYGGPHILSLVTEVATRCLKAVRRQKFNFHRRMRPEALAGRLSLVACGDKIKKHLDKGEAHPLGCAKGDFERAWSEIPGELLDAIRKHNIWQNDPDEVTRDIWCSESDPKWLDGCNILLPMAFPEGSPMHPAYGAGHATVAGGCVTMVKAFFEMFEDCDGALERPLCHDNKIVDFIPSEDGRKLESAKLKKPLSIQGELDKLAANISIGRNMAGVHYYSDYYDSLRMGERIAVGILLEQAPTYGEPIQTTFTSFDGDHITISGQGYSAGSLTVRDHHGNPVDPRDWWLRHVVGEEVIEDF